MEDLSGKTFADLEVEHEIARGGMGVVYKAFQREMKRTVALKILLPEIADSSRQTKRFIREAKVNSQLQHPNVIQVYGMGKERGLYYFTMQYIPGMTFKEYQALYSLRENIQTLIKICYAIDYAHKLDVVHRDLKPANVLMDANKEPYIADFGLAKLIDGEMRSRLTQTGSTLGTPAYMSPEQVRGDKNLDYRADIYSLGVMLYELLTEQRMFEAKSFNELTQKICHELPVLPTTINPDIPQNLEDICLKAIEKNPRHRYQKATHMAKDLENFLVGKKIITGQGIMANLRKWQIQNKVAAITIAVAILLTIVSISIKLIINHQTESQKKQSTRKQTYINKVIQDAYDNPQYQTAQKILEKAIHKFPQNPQLYQALSDIQLSNDDKDKARISLKIATKLNPNSPSLLIQKSLFHSSLKEYKLAEELLNRYIDLVPDDEKGFRQRALVRREQGLAFQEDMQKANKIAIHKNKELLAQVPKLPLQQAISRLEDAKLRFPGYDEIYIQLAQLYQQQEKWDLALQNIAQAVETNPILQTTIQKAAILFHKKEFEESYQVLQNFRGKLNSQGYFLMGKSLLEMERLTEAMEVLQQSLKESKQNSPIYLHIGKCYYLQENFLKALEYLKKVCQSQTQRKRIGEAWFYRGLAYKRLNDTPKATNCLKEAINYPSRLQYRSYYELGKIYFKQKKLKLATNSFVKAIEGYPKSDCFYLLAKCYQVLGRKQKKYYQQGIDAVNQAIQLEPWNDKFLYLRALLHKKLDNWQEFEKDISSCIRLQPRDASYPFQLIQGFIENEKDAFINYRKTLWLWRTTVQSPAVRSITPPDLFRSENLQQHKKYFQHKLTPGQSWNPSQAKTLLSSYLKTKDLTSQKTALVIFMAMAHNRDLQSLLREKLTQESLPSIHRSKLNKLLDHVQQKHYEKLRKNFYRLMLRTYISRDQTALLEIYNMGESALDVIEKILISPENSGFMKFMAAKTLWELRTPAARERLKKCVLSQDFQTSLYACVASQTYPQVRLPEDWYKTFSPFTRSLIAQKVDLAQKKVVLQLLQDPDVRVQLYIARRLPPSRKVLDLLETLLNHSSSEIRHSALVIYGSMISQEEANKKIDLWKKSIVDPNPKVRRAVSVILRKVKHPEISNILYQRVVEDSDYVTRFLSLTSLVIRNDKKQVLKVFHNSKINPFLRLSIFLNENSFKLPPRKFLTVLQDPSPTMRTFIHSHFSHVLPYDGAKRLAFSILESSQDFHSRLGCLFSIISLRHHMHDLLPKVEHLLKDKNEELRFVVAAAVILSNRESYSPRVKFLFNKFLQDDALRQGAAQGLKILGYDHLFNNSAKFPYWNYDFVYRENIRRMLTRHEKPYIFEFRIPYTNHYQKEHELRIVRELQKKNLLPQERHLWKVLGLRNYQNLKNNKKYKALFQENRIKVFEDNKLPIIGYQIFSHSQKFYLEVFEQLNELEPNNAENLFALGLQYYLDNQRHHAIKFIQKAVDIEPKSFFRLWLAKLYYFEKNYDKAWQITEELNKEIPWDHELVDLRVNILEKGKNEKFFKAEQQRLELLETKR